MYLCSDIVISDWIGHTNIALLRPNYASWNTCYLFFHFLVHHLLQQGSPKEWVREVRPAECMYVCISMYVYMWYVCMYICMYVCVLDSIHLLLSRNHTLVIVCLPNACCNSRDISEPAYLLQSFLFMFLVWLKILGLLWVSPHTKSGSNISHVINIGSIGESKTYMNIKHLKPSFLAWYPTQPFVKNLGSLLLFDEWFRNMFELQHE